MATVLRNRFSYHRRLFLLLLVFSWTLVGCFILFQYGREKHFKAERLDAQLQLFNLRMLDALADGATPEEFIAAALSPSEVISVQIENEAARACQVIVPADQLSLAIGNKGQNVRLAARLTGWKIDIGPQSQEQEIVEQHEQLKAQTQAEIDKAVDDLFADDFDFE